MGKRTVRVLASAGVVATLMLGATSSAQARIVERDHWSFTDSFAANVCGMDVEIEEEGRGVFMIRAGRGDSTAFFASNTFSLRAVVTNPENGKWLVVEERGHFREVAATHVEGDVYLFRAHLAGQPFVVEDSTGKVVHRDNGLLVFEQLFDTFGDDEPGGEELSFELVAVRGFPQVLDDECVLLLELLG